MREPAPAPRRAGLVSWAAAVAVVAATYLYFLIFAEFAFLELALAAAGPARLRGLMLALGAGGIAGAALAGWGLRRGPDAVVLTWALRGGAASALGALLAQGPLALATAAGAVGLSLGAATVALATALRPATGSRHLGLCIGAGTGLAYALCNVPALFRAAPAVQTAVAAAAIAAASLLPRFLPAEPRAEAGEEGGRGQVTRWLAILLALVWLDSAAFYIIQHTPGLRAATWGEAGALWANAAVHLGAAVAAGLLLDRGGRGWLVGAAACALAGACLILDGTLPALLPAGWAYTAGVSLYSTVLVEYPARTGRAPVAAVVFGIAGWLGSALGIGMAQDLARVPGWFVAVAALTVAVALVWRRRAAGRLALAGMAAVAASPAGRADEVARGREVYIAEGCVHCHSQYVRPRSARDVERWGPSDTLEAVLAGAPPLFGARRQGPDLSHVGNRRSAEWQRLHLVSPQAVSPGSRMPSYAYLFAGDAARGDALVAYLMSLGAETAAQRQAAVAAWQPAPVAPVPPERARRLFARLCSGCHGPAGGGDGPLAPRLSLPPPDWSRTPWRHVPAGVPAELAVSRIVKFGLPGLPMAGHEYLPDAEVLGLARHAQSLHIGGAGGPSAASTP